MGWGYDLKNYKTCVSTHRAIRSNFAGKGCGPFQGSFGIMCGSKGEGCWIFGTLRRYDVRDMVFVLCKYAVVRCPLCKMCNVTLT